MPVKIINADFYRVKVEDKNKRGFCDLVDVVESMPKGAGRAQHRAEDAIRLQAVHKGQTTLSAEMLRIRLHESHVRAKVSGETAELQLDDDEGLGEETAFVFHEAPSILVVQRNRAGVTASVFAKYLKILCKAQSIVFEPVLKKGAMERIQKMQTIRKFEVHFAGVQNGRALRGRGHSAGKMFSVLEEFQAPNGTISVAVGRKPGALQNVVNAVKELVQNQDEAEPEVSKIVVVGSEGDADEKAVIDLFQDRLTEAVEVEVKDGKRLSSAQRFRALGKARERHKEYLSSYTPG